MDYLASYLGLFMGYFAFTIGAFILEFIINKSNGGKWGYKISITVLVLNVLLILFGVWYKSNRGY